MRGLPGALVGAAAVLLALAPDPAGAATVARNGSELRVVAAAGEQNEIYVEIGDRSALSAPSDVLVVRDPFLAVQAGDGCTAHVTSFQPVAAACPLDGLTQVVIETGDGNDRVNPLSSPIPVSADGGPGDDLLGGSPVAGDRLAGGPGADQLSGASGDTLVGDDGDDELSGFGDDVTLSGGAGDDRLRAANGSGSALTGGPGDDDLEGGSGADELSGGPGDDDLLGGNGDDMLQGDAGADDLDGGRGRDAVDGGAGEDDLDGERGDDEIVSDDGVADHSIACGQGADDLRADRFDAVNVDCDRVIGPTLPVADQGLVAFALACPNGCAGRLTVLTPAGATIGRGTFGGSLLAARVRGTRPSVRLNARGRSLLARRARLRVQVAMRIVDGTGRRFRVSGRYTLARR